MFTGIIEDTGRVEALLEHGSGAEASFDLAISSRLAGEPMALGASLSVDGVCLTVVAWTPGRVTVTAGPETLSRTTLGQLHSGAIVNLERALRLGDRLGGHWVMGHVDGVGQIIARQPRGAAVDITLGCPADLLRYVVEKGSITVAGISLTVNAVDEHGLQVSLIPHTQGATTLARLAVGGRVNIEVDVLGKYVEKLLKSAPVPNKEPGGITLDKLKEHGFV